VGPIDIDHRLGAGSTVFQEAFVEKHQSAPFAGVSVAYPPIRRIPQDPPTITTRCSSRDAISLCGTQTTGQNGSTPILINPLVSCNQFSNGYLNGTIYFVATPKTGDPCFATFRTVAVPLQPRPNGTFSSGDPLP
jgi:hypothetical protein